MAGYPLGLYYTYMYTNCFEVLTTMKLQFRVRHGMIWYDMRGKFCDGGGAKATGQNKNKKHCIHYIQFSTSPENARFDI